MADQNVAGSLLSNFENITEEQLLSLARITETAERFEDMCEIMGQLVQKKNASNGDLAVEERNMLSVAYKNVVGQRRASWRTLKEEVENSEATPEVKALKQKYKQLVEEELDQKCREVLQLLDNNLVKEQDSKINECKNKSPNDLSQDERDMIERQVFYLKMCGDYHRYLAEFNPSDQVKEKASQRYDAAMELAKCALQPTHPTRLGLALNASVCYYEIMKQPKKACELAKSAFDEAIQKLDSLSDATYKDSTLIMQLLRDNLTIWTSEDGNNQVEDRED